LGEDGIYRGAPVDAEKVAAAMGIETKGMDDTMKAQVVQLAHDEAELAAAESHDASGGLTVDDDGRILSPDKDPVTKAAGDGGKKLMEMSTEEKASHLEAQKEAAKEKNKEKLAAFQSQRGSGSSREMSAEEKKAMLEEKKAKMLAEKKELAAKTKAEMVAASASGSSASLPAATTSPPAERTTVDDDGRIVEATKTQVAAGEAGKKLTEMTAEEKAANLEAQKEANKEKVAAFQSQRSSHEMSKDEKKAMLEERRKKLMEAKQQRTDNKLAA